MRKGEKFLQPLLPLFFFFPPFPFVSPVDCTGGDFRVWRRQRRQADRQDVASPGDGRTKKEKGWTNVLGEEGPKQGELDWKWREKSFFPSSPNHDGLRAKTEEERRERVGKKKIVPQEVEEEERMEASRTRTSEGKKRSALLFFSFSHSFPFPLLFFFASTPSPQGSKGGGEGEGGVCCAGGRRRRRKRWRHKVPKKKKEKEGKGGRGREKSC